MKKGLIIGLIVLVIAIGAGVYYLMSNLGSLVAAAIERNGSEVTDTAVNVSGVKISLRDGRASISGLVISSPEGFDAGDAFVLGDITIDLDVASVREDPIILDEVLIRAPVIRAEVKKNGSSNIDELRKRAQAYSASRGESEGEVQKRIRIRKFVFEQGRIEVDASELGIEKQTVTLPEIRLNDVGGERGVPPDQVAKLILTRVAKEAASQIARSEANRLIEEQVEETLSDKAKDVLKGISN